MNHSRSSPSWLALPLILPALIAALPIGDLDPRAAAREDGDRGRVIAFVGGETITVEQLEANAKAAELELSDTHVAELDEASSFKLGYPYDFMKGIMGGW